eukprot:3853-Alexandrium_andersonii.AAC.1
MAYWLSASARGRSTPGCEGGGLQRPPNRRAPRCRPCRGRRKWGPIGKRPPKSKRSRPGNPTPSTGAS